jgi:class 3 adenylate cyclase
MTDTKKTQQGGGEGNITRIDELLREREQIDKVLEEKFARRSAIFFTDVVGSTSFYEAHGDIAGRMLIQRHNDLAFPIVNEMGGTIVKTTGDGMLAAFDAPATAVRAAVKIQEAVKEYNAAKISEQDRVHLRIGMHYGTTLVDTNDIYGDVVNTCARILSCSEPNQVVMSETVYHEVKREEGVYVRYASSQKFKGKSQPMKIYQVLWRDEDFETVAAAAGMLRSFGRQRSFCLDAARDGDKLKIATYEREEGKELTLRQYEETTLNAEAVESRVRTVYELLNQANVQGRVEPSILDELQKTGALLFDELLTKDAKERLRATKASSLVLYIDDSLVQIPWEMLYDGKSFLARRFGVGRIVRTRQTAAQVTPRALHAPLRMLVVADPRRDLEQSYKEGVEIRDLLAEKEDKIKVDFVSSRVSVDFVKKNIKNYDIIHYAGHADYDAGKPSASAWKLTDGDFSAADVLAMAGGEPLPSIVFSNGCQSGQTQEWKLSDTREVYGLANAFLLAGVQHYIGTFWDVRDKHSMDFAQHFYRALLSGASVGEAMRQAREGLIKSYGEELIVWSSYMLYGDPTARPFEVKQTAEEFLEAQEQLAVAGGLRSGAGAAAASAVWPVFTGMRDRTTLLLLAGLGVLLLAAIVAPLFRTPPPVVVNQPSLVPPVPMQGPGAPAAQAQPLKLSMNADGRRLNMWGEFDHFIVSENYQARTGDEVRFTFEVNNDAYVYLILYAAEGDAQVLFPHPSRPFSNPVRGGVQYELPGSSGWWPLTGAGGTETIFMVASKEPITSIQNLLAEIDGAPREQRLAQSNAVNSELQGILTQTRGFGEVVYGEAQTIYVDEEKKQKIDRAVEIVQGYGEVARMFQIHH